MVDEAVVGRGGRYFCSRSFGDVEELNGFFCRYALLASSRKGT